MIDTPAASPAYSRIRSILLDMTMPGMDGEEAFHELRAIRSDVPVVLCSGYSEQQVAGRFVGKGLAGFLKKPFRMRDLEKCIRTVLEDDGREVAP